ncbi:MAG: acetyl-CoA carboxylase biotin carboxylase subunit [Bacteroidota bacterium]|nr:acetyl-CoA carboxylase biotin carboxylase subunit [Candidatus Kapabacteria bacterium]MDW8220062.1 acetyl-CoA carboxylase biotin carboxylase subunit [Bacteroidota bacterium]
MFKKILIANRGEIALRIIRTCRAMGIATVAIYSDADRQSLHVTAADEAVRIGGFTPRESYLVMDKVLDAAQKTGAEAIHPGYGFLSENHEFARRVTESGLVFIGPSPEAIERLGDKTAARALAQVSNVPFAAGSTDAVSSFEEVREFAERIGFPVILKAAAGGGGKGMRVVERIEDLEHAFRAAQGEALTAFGDNRVFIEKYIVRPRHIEIQILADNHGTVLYFPERECSIQRRHQKVIEESPSTAVTPELRKAMGEAAARLVQTARYTNAGTLEFLVDASGNFYFMEVNTRLQVEHPVTEMVTGVDLVEQQIRIAAGEALSLTQEQIAVPRGHAIECRICVEDVYNDFFPDSGIVSYLSLPQADYIRNESSLYVGYESGIHYDSMAAKLVVWGSNRQEAIERTLHALRNYHIGGFNTTIPFCLFALDSDAFRTGQYSTFFVQEHWRNQVPRDIQHIVAAAAALTRSTSGNRRKPQFPASSIWAQQYK